MQYISTRDPQQQTVSAAQAIWQGLAPDGGLYVPQSFPAYQPASWQGLGYRQVAREIFALYLTDFSAEEIAGIVDRAYGAQFPPAVAPCVSVGEVEVLELFHGPTSAFKDMALQALPQILTRAIPKTGREQEVVILVATSGDTGKAALEGFKDVPGCRIIAFYPAGGVSEIQEKQMLTTGGANTAVVAVQGNFDDCQTGVKRLFADADFQARLQAGGKVFSSANSINFGRLLPQIVYYYYAYAQLVAKGRIQAGQEIAVSVPTGNFGNILACYYAKRMGLPVARLICASNENDVLTEAIQSGRYNRQRPFYKTTSPSMDILVSSNFERFLYEMYGRDAAACAGDLRALSETGAFTVPQQVHQNWQGFLSAGSANKEQAARMIAAVYGNHGYVLDPHTAVGWAVASQQAPEQPLLLAATASPYKFPEAVLRALHVEADGLDGAQLMQKLAQVSGGTVPQNLSAVTELPPRHQIQCAVEEMPQTVAQLLQLGQ